MAAHEAHQGFEVVRLHEGLVALNVEDDFGAWTLPVGEDFGGAGGSVGAVGRGHAHAASEGKDGVGDACVVGGHHRGHDGRDAFPDVLDHGLAGNVRQRFARKAGAGVARRNDGKNLGHAAG